MGESSISVNELTRWLGTASMPTVIDVRRRGVYEADAAVLPTARWRDHGAVDSWAAELDPKIPVVLYCVHGHQVSQASAAVLRARGYSVAILSGGIEAWRAAGATLVAKSGWPGRDETGPSRWVTRAAPKIDRIACPWFIRRFVDRSGEILFVEADQVVAAAAEIGAIPFDVDGVEFSHRGDRCTFDAFLERFEVDDPALFRLADIVRGADTGRLDAAPQAAGLLAISLGISALAATDEQALARGIDLYDALYAWCRIAVGQGVGSSQAWGGAGA